MRAYGRACAGRAGMLRATVRSPRRAGWILALAALAAAPGCARRAVASAAEPLAHGPPPVPDVPGLRAPLDAEAAALPEEVWRVASPRPWKVVVLHHSASAVGGAERFDGWHRAKGWDGVGYDFVIGNGTDTADGALETTFRWR